MKRLLVVACLLASCASTEPSTSACIVTIVQSGGDRLARYEIVRIKGDANADEYWVLRDGYDQPVNVPKSRVLRRGERRFVGNVVCRCPEFQ